MLVADFDYCLPPDQIAQEPVEPRDTSRLMVLHRASGTLENRRFYELLQYLHPGDALVLNKTRVFPARLLGVKEDSGGKIEVLLLREEGGLWEALVRPGRRLQVGTRLSFGEGKLLARVEAITGEGERLLSFTSAGGELRSLLQELGQIPLPPYIKNQPADINRYQTVYAREEGSAAAPTAGLHFTPELMEKIQEAGVEVVYLLLHVGLGTFRPVRAEQVEKHQMHAEYYCLEDEATLILNRCRERGGRLVAVGTTVVRTLETLAGEDGVIQAGSGWTKAFIFPGYRFKAVQALITNFHLPRSTLLMLVSAFAGQERIRQAYQVAIKERYRFYSFGDAMLII